MLLVLGFSNPKVTPQKLQTNPSFLNIGLQKYLQSLEKKGFSGTILIAKKGEIIVHNAYGMSDKSRGLKNGKKTIYDIGSVTKQFTAAAILKLEMHKKLSVNDPISKYFVEIPMDKKEITIHHLLTHTSGLVASIGSDYEEISEKDFLHRVFASQLKSDIGEKFRYSNIGYSLLSIIIEKVSGMGYETFLNKELFRPSGMQNTGYRLPNWDSNSIAKGYSKKREHKKPNEEHWGKDGPFLNLMGNGGILSNAEDLFKWHTALLGNAILDKKAKEKYFYPHIPEDASGESFYAYGWVHMPFGPGRTAIWHNGGNGIFFGDFWRFVQEDVAIIVMSNKYRRAKDDVIAEKISTIIL
ncbi:serine hydrolase [Ulvibacterium sp.]|uniref:serine hydrolase domain-containing protein n=1 Tax=Ulvibacterium sp. TaxID=2665914 RepID=UPI002632C47B|nr:serine hydrolase domain-containing protein [Ulvibacterium sp.]